MLQPVEGMTFPSRCPFPSCRANLHQEWVLGVMPKFLGMVNAIIRCRTCERVYAFTMPVTAVEPFVESLPKDEEGFPFGLTRKKPDDTPTTKEIQDFGNKEIGPDETSKIIKAFSVLDEYDALGYYGDTDRGDIRGQSPDDSI